VLLTEEEGIVIYAVPASSCGSFKCTPSLVLIVNFSVSPVQGSSDVELSGSRLSFSSSGGSAQLYNNIMKKLRNVHTLQILIRL
jgi:hypothetical protein